MGFLDKLNQTLQSGANVVQTKGKQISETAKLNSQLSSNRQQIDNTLKSIGQLVCDKYLEQLGDSEITASAQLIERLKASNEEITARLLELKGVQTRTCTNCGATLAPGTVFCAECGTKNDPAEHAAQTSSVQTADAAVQPQPAKVNVRPVITPAPTAAENEGFSSYAPEPQPIPQPEFTQYTPAQETPAPAAQTAPSDGIFCTNCGYKETPDALFCSNCGSRLEK